VLRRQGTFRAGHLAGASKIILTQNRVGRRRGCGDVDERETFVARGLEIVLARIGGCWLFEHHRRELHREFDANGVCLPLDSEQRATLASQNYDPRRAQR
jgi:hypothetical protein